MACTITLLNEHTCTSQPPVPLAHEFIILIHGDHLIIGDREVPSLQLVTNDTGISKHNGIKLDPVIAGRGFHWQKSVSMTFPGNLTFTNHEGYLLVVNEIPLEAYLMCVATSEMGSACPPALIEAQTIVARSFILANVEKKHNHLGFDFCNDDCCQRYHGTEGLTPQSIRGSEQSHGLVPVFQDIVCDTRYSKSCGGMMESFSAVWGGENPTYFQVKPDIMDPPAKPDLRDEQLFRKWVDEPPRAFCSPEYVPENELSHYLGGVDEDSHYFRWRLFYSQAELTELIAEKSRRSLQAIEEMIPLQRGGSGRITRLEILARDGQGNRISLILDSEYQIRAHLHVGFLYSSAFYITPIQNGDVPSDFFIHGCGWGHGAGLCQIGALGMALSGFQSDDIIKHYYPGITLKRLYS